MGTFTTILSIAQKSVNSFYYMFGFESIVFLWMCVISTCYMGVGGGGVEMVG